MTDTETLTPDQIGALSVGDEITVAFKARVTYAYGRGDNGVEFVPSSSGGQVLAHNGSILFPDFDISDGVLTVTREAEPFKPGDVVRNRATRMTYTLGHAGYFCHATGLDQNYIGGETCGDIFKSDRYERVFSHA